MNSIYCVSKPWGNCWCLDERSAPVKASGGSQANATSTSKRLCKWIRTAKAALIRGAGEQSQMATREASEKKLSHSLSISGMRKCPYGRVAPVAVPREGPWSHP